ncbi:MAG: Lrp/AsnC family transcriptional regulator [Promethearchaeota archaeon]
MIKIDDKDRMILNILQNNDKISFSKMKRTLKMAASTIHFRVKKLEKSGIIKSFSAIIDPTKVGFNTIAWLGLSAEPTKIKDVAKKIAVYKEAQLVAISTGDHDLVVQLISENEKSLWRFINEKIKTIDGIKSQMDVSSFIQVFKNSNFIEL